MTSRALSILLRLSSAMLTIIALVVFFLKFGDARTGGVVTVPVLVLCTAIAIALALTLAAVADVLSHRNDAVSDLARSVSRMDEQLRVLQERIADTAVAMDRLGRNRSPGAVAGVPSTGEAFQARSAVRLAPHELDPMVRLLEEIRDTSLLTDTERHDRLKQLHHDRKLLLVRQAIDHVEHQRWSDGNLLLQKLEADHPEDFDVKRTRQQFDIARRNAETVTVEKARPQVENLMAISSWEHAEHLARKLIEDFPGNIDARTLLARVVRERDIFRETTVSRMVEEIRHDIDRRLWRRALMHTKKLLEKYADHPKAQRLREQLLTIQDNAEIEERQEQEVQIQELIRSRKFNEAIQLSEDLLSRFPSSPQAEAIEVLLPRIRELAKEDEEETSAAP